MSIGIIAAALAVASGSIIGILLGLIGSGGSILAVPLLVYLVGVPSVHVAIGTGAIAVALNAAFGLAGHARLGTVKCHARSSLPQPAPLALWPALHLARPSMAPNSSRCSA